MAKVNHSKYALLGMLSFQPMSGYDIKQHSENSVNHFWTISYTQIYAMLKRLEADGMVSKREEQTAEGRPNRFVYALTDIGREALQGWLRAPVAPEPGRLIRSLKLFFGHEVSVEDNCRHIKSYQQELQTLLANYEAIEQTALADPTRAERLRHAPDYAFMTLRRGLHIVRANLAWCEETLAVIDNWKLTSE